MYCANLKTSFITELEHVGIFNLKSVQVLLFRSSYFIKQLAANNQYTLLSFIGYKVNGTFINIVNTERFSTVR